MALLGRLPILAFLLVSILLMACFGQVSQDSVTDQTKVYENNWPSLQTHKTPDWFRDAKFGIYCHWGPYSVPAYETEWYSHWMYQEGHPIRSHHETTYGSLDTFGYQAFIPKFKGEKFDPEAWAELMAAAGAKFGGPVSEHADGFAMWDSRLTTWDAKDRGPKRDIVGEMAEALRARGLKFIATYHRQWFYGWFPTWDSSVDASNPEYAGLYGPKLPKGSFAMANEKQDPLPDSAFNQAWLDRIVEVVDRYQPDLVWFDNRMDIIGEEYRKEFLTHYYNQAAIRKQEVVVTYKFEDLAKGSAVLDLERARMSEKKEFPWLTDDSIDWGSWSHVQDPEYKSVNRLVDFLIDVVSKNGCLLLNITPKANGEIPLPVQERLREMGAWLDQNGEAIYGSRPWKIYGEGPTEIVEGHLSERKNRDHGPQDIRYTTQGDTLYAILLGWPEGQAAQFPALGKQANLLSNSISSIDLLGYEESLNWKQTEDHLSVQLPDAPPGQHAFVFRIVPSTSY